MNDIRQHAVRIEIDYKIPHHKSDNDNVRTIDDRRDRSAVDLIRELDDLVRGQDVRLSLPSNSRCPLL